MKKKQGISLIVLVITIIVMIILASAVIISLNNNGIINRANEAVDEANLAEVQHIASLAWSEAYLDHMNETEAERDVEIKRAVEQALKDNKLKLEDYEITYGVGGVTVAIKDSEEEDKEDTIETTKWKLKRTTDANGIVDRVYVTDGKQEMEVGSTINYMPEGINGYTGGWGILGADEEGRLLIMSTESITGRTLSMGNSFNIEETKNAVVGALNTLQNMVKDYKDGEIGIAVRSITAEDVNAITGFKPEEYTTEFMGVSNVKSYGKKVTYTWNSEGVGYSWKNGTETKTGNLSDSHENGFTYYTETNEGIGETITVAKATSGEIVTVENTYYRYNGRDVLNKNTPAYKMIFAVIDDGSHWYWLANINASVYTYYVLYHIMKVGGLNVCSSELGFTSAGETEYRL